MGCKRDFFVVLIVLNAWLWQLVHGGSQSYSRESLDSYLYNYAFKKIKRLRSGKLYDVVPPPNFPGMEIDIIRLRTSSLWKNGLSHASFTIPPKILPWPFTRRVDIVYQNLGNWSSDYYNVPNHTFVAPVVGFLAYDSTNNSLIKLRTMRGDGDGGGGGGDEPFVVDFSSHVAGGVDMRCVRFESNGTLELSSMTKGSSCVGREQGHYSVVVPYGVDNEAHKWWIMGIAAAAVGLMWLVVVCVVGWKRMTRKKIRRMEQESERREGLESIWIGRSRMPCAVGIRTQPVLESSYLP